MIDLGALEPVAEAAILPLRQAGLVLAFLNLCWMMPLSVAAILNREVPWFPNAGFAIPAAGLVFGIFGFNSAYLVEGIPQVLHWRKALNLAIIDVSLLVFLLLIIGRLLGIRRARKRERAAT